MPDRELTNALLEVIRARMSEQGLSGRALAERVGAKPSAFADRLRGQGDMSVDELDAVAVALGGSRLEELVEEARRRL